MLKIRYIITQTLFLCSFTFFVEGSAIDILYKNREIVDKDIACIEERKTGSNLRESSFVFFRKNVDQPLSFWEKEQLNYLRTVFDICLNISKMQNDTSYVLNSGIYVDLLFEMLKEKIEGVSYDQIVRILMRRTARQALQKHEYYKAIMKNAPLGQSDRTKLLCLMNLDKNEKDSILNNSETPLIIRARLGDKSAEDSIIDQYKNQKYYRYKADNLRTLFYIGSDRVLHFIASYFNETFYDDRGGCINESIQYRILLGLRQFHPYEPLLNKPLAELSKKQAFFHNDDEVKQYLKEVRDWIKNTYGVDFVHEVPVKPILRGLCPSK